MPTLPLTTATDETRDLLVLGGLTRLAGCLLNDPSSDGFKPTTLLFGLIASKIYKQKGSVKKGFLKNVL